MALKASATRYARALLDVAISQSDPTRIEHELSSFSSLLADHPDLHRALTNPRVPVAARTSLIGALAERAGIDGIVARLLVLLVERGRFELLPAIVDAYRERLLAHRRIVRAQVTSATPLAPERQDGLRKSLSRVTGKDVQLEVETDPALIGGLVARIGSTVYDGSIRMQLHKMRRQLVDGA
jgi:F-type H+-transporting ATPase subunit delta